ncbi:hypothetical protein D3C84_806270 [compost metagenome]
MIDSSSGCQPRLFHTRPMACSMHFENISRSGLGIDGGMVRMIERRCRGTLEWLMRERCEGLLICISACPSTSDSMKVINELRE